MNKNNIRYICAMTLYQLAGMMIAGSVLQAFWLENGLTQAQVTGILSLFQLVQVGGMMLFSLMVDRIRSTLAVYRVTVILQVVFLGSLVVLCLMRGMELNLKYAVMLGFGLFSQCVMAVHGIVDYKVPYLVMDVHEYGKISGYVGVVYGISGAALSAVMSWATAAGDYNRTMMIFFGLGIGMLLAAYLVSGGFETVATAPAEPKNGQKKKVNIFKYKPFWVLLLPNFLRGLCSGVLNTAMTIGYSMGLTNQSSGAVLTLLLQLATIIGCFIYSRISHGTNGKIILVSSLTLLVSMPAMVMGQSLILFYAMYLLANFFVNFINYAVPTAIVEMVSYKYIGQYTSWRMLVYTLGAAVANATMTGVMEGIGVLGLMIAAAMCQVISGIVYWWAYKKFKDA